MVIVYPLFQMNGPTARLAAFVAMTVILILILLGNGSAEIANGKANNPTKVPEKKKTLNLAGIFPMHGTEGWQGGLVSSATQVFTLSNHAL